MSHLNRIMGDLGSFACPDFPLRLLLCGLGVLDVGVVRRRGVERRDRAAFGGVQVDVVDQLKRPAILY